MYYLMFLVPLALHPLKIDNRIKGILNSVALGLMAIFRFGAGSDYFSYSYLYYLSSKSSILKLFSTLKDQEIGFKLLMFPFRFLHLPYEAFVASIAILIMTLMYFWIQKNAKSVSLSYLVYYSFFFMVWNLSSLRQGLVITIGCFLLFNQQFQWKFRTKLLIIGSLCLLHITAIFYLVFLLADQLKWDRKKLTYVVLGALLVSLLPVGNIALLIAKIPVFARVASYIDPATAPFGFWDIKSLPRLFLIFIVLYHYDPLMKKGVLPAYVMNSYIIGISFFFILRFDDLIGARISIYGFFLAVLILPAILDLYDKRKWITVAATTGFIAMCALYLQKELSAMAHQAGIEAKGYYVPYVTIFQEKRVGFTNDYYYANNYNNFLDAPACVAEMTRFADKLEMRESTIKDNSKFIPVKFPNGKYGLIDTEGHIVLDGRFGPIEYYGGIIRVSSTEYYNV
ncbi:MAG: EpsG family protein, partial [Erysipelotrichaceae bacterium]